MSEQSLNHVVIALGLAGALAASGCAAPAGAGAAPETAAPVVLVAQAKAANAVDAAVGRVVSRAAFAVSSETGGRVVRIDARVGDRVRKGQALAWLDGVVVAANGSAAKADLLRAQRAADDRAANLDRVRKLFAAGVSSRAELDGAEAEAAAAQAAVAAAKAGLASASRAEREAVVRAPADGIIAARHIELSQSMAPGAVAFEIDGQGGLEIEAMVSDDALSHLSRGDVVAFHAGSTAGTATFMGAAGRTGAGGARFARFAITQGDVAPGAAVDLHVRAKQKAGAAGGALVPLGAVLTARDGARRVLVVENDALVERPVKLASVTGVGAIVVGLEPGVEVVAAGGEFLTAGARVRPASTLR